MEVYAHTVLLYPRQLVRKRKCITFGVNRFLDFPEVAYWCEVFIAVDINIIYTSMDINHIL